MNSKSIEIAGRRIGDDAPPYIIAELSANHNGDLQKALDTISAAKESGADAIKLQTYTADTMTIDCDKEDFLVRGGLWDGYKLYDLYKWAQTPFEWQHALFERAKEEGITCFSTPFDETAVDLLEELGSPAYKIASFEMTDTPLIKYIASKGKPIIMSTGMANLEEISEAIDAASSAGCSDLVLLHCLSSYPAPVDQSNLRTISDMRKRFNRNIGLSDHTIGNTAAITSVALGACVIEKHFTLDRKDKGPDSEFSIEPSELKQLCESAKDAWMALGEAGYDLKPAEEASMKFRRSIYFVRDLVKGRKISEADIRRIRPGYGLAPKYFDDLVGRTVSREVKAGDATSWEVVENE